MLVYCTKCGTQNEDTASSCIKCGASLNPPPYREARGYKREYREDECFGGRNYIWPLIIGSFIILIGVSSLLGGNIWEKIWPIFIIVVGLIIVLSAITKRNSTVTIRS